MQAEFKLTDSGLKNVTYTYNAIGQRNSKTVGGITTYFIYDLQGRVLAELDAQGKTVRDNVYLGPEQIATFSGGQPTYIFNDHLATPVLAVDASGHPVWTIETDPFGATKKIYRATDIAARFPGQYADEETGFNYNFNRTYDPFTGRYIESDPIGLNGGINTYAYAEGNPLLWFDLFGLLPGDLFASPDDSALDAGRYARTFSNQEVEYSGWVFRKGKCWTYNFQIGNPRDANNEALPKIRPKVPIAVWHTHPKNTGNIMNEENFSGDPWNPADGGGDIATSATEKIGMYLNTPKGKNLYFNVYKNPMRRELPDKDPAVCGCK